MEPRVLTVSFLAILALILSPVSSSTTVTQQNTYSTFVKTSCSSATYPSACRKSLLPYAATVQTNPLKLATVALSATLNTANATLSTITKLSKTKQITNWEAAVLKDCIGDIKDSMDEVKSSINEINGISTSANKRFAISNAQTWTSAAITDENSCLDGFSDGQINPTVKKKIRNSIVNLARVSSNALYLINHLSV
ncbi:putative pectinesterase [Helianthus annuus]|uniref:Pectinesterase n=1 Tax=Helianthus annuus TaxID=4232 RepID=A0A251SMN7_HELAN|nr:pectinesterase inhibitor 4 [Helianthus annuus]KAF5771272.1 putative pectinesterase [Helianthus annuus]KAJ0466122.1 putative pectinesterase [Helianthus annuus]KAJ0487691.1 putative pectinesterase [Helianthus annuus]KAJ0856090.1 putative pectinesterase [Helianthus annuus]